MHFPTLEPLSLFSQYKGRINVPLYRTELNRVGRPTCLVLFARGQKTLLCKDAGTVGEKKIRVLKYLAAHHILGYERN